ncbi:glycosyl hydrolase family 28-related protein [Terribacillus saccharophilus]|uniref:glycosyl hydrolase family 28-related protein n=1 Tax=Terribacillus saccharophilus TaxID=361277 RepID=UPI0039820765
MDNQRKLSAVFCQLAETLRDISRNSNHLIEELSPAHTVVATDHPLVRADGRHDDAKGIQQLLNLADRKKGIHIVFPPGLYTLRRPLRLKQNTFLEADGNSIFRKMHHGPMLLNLRRWDRMRAYRGNGNIIIRGGQWDANYPAYRGGTSFVIAHAENVIIEQLQLLEHGGGHAIELNAMRNLEVRNCKFLGYDDRGGERAYSEAIQLDLAKARRVFPWGGSVFDHTACQDIWIHHNDFGPSDKKGSWGRAVGSHSATSGRWHERIFVTDNVMKETLQWAVRAYSWRDVVLYNNRVESCGGGIAIHPNYVDGRNDTDSKNRPTGRSNPIRNFLIIGNKIVGGGTYASAIRLKGDEQSPITGAYLRTNHVESYPGRGILVTGTKTGKETALSR